MRIAVIGAAGRTGRPLVRQALERGHEVRALCRESSLARLGEFEGHAGFTAVAAPVVSDAAALAEVLDGCEAALAVLISVGPLKATDLVGSLERLATAPGLTRLIFTAGEITSPPAVGEVYTLRQRVMLAIATPLIWLTPYSLTDMRLAARAIQRHDDWNWTIVRAATLTDDSPGGYRLCALAEITGRHRLARADYAACLLDRLDDPSSCRQLLTVAPRKTGRPA